MVQSGSRAVVDKGRPFSSLAVAVIRRADDHVIVAVTVDITSSGHRGAEIGTLTVARGHPGDRGGQRVNDDRIAGAGRGHGNLHPVADQVEADRQIPAGGIEGQQLAVAEHRFAAGQGKGDGPVPLLQPRLQGAGHVQAQQQLVAGAAGQRPVQGEPLLEPTFVVDVPLSQPAPDEFHPVAGHAQAGRFRPAQVTGHADAGELQAPTPVRAIRCPRRHPHPLGREVEAEVVRPVRCPDRVYRPVGPRFGQDLRPIFQPPDFRLGLGPPVGRHPFRGSFWRGQGPGPARQQKDRGQQQRRHCSDLLLLRFVHCNLPARVRESTWSGPPQAPCRWRTMAWKRLRDKCFNGFCQALARTGKRPEAGWIGRAEVGRLWRLRPPARIAGRKQPPGMMDQAKVPETG